MTGPSKPRHNTRRAKGIAAYARLLDVTDLELPTVFAGRVGEAFAEEAFEAAGSPVWDSSALTARERSLAVIASLAAQGVTGDRLTTHAAVGQRAGLDDDAFSALLILLAPYIGYPRASLAMETIHARNRSPNERKEPEGGCPGSCRAT